MKIGILTFHRCINYGSYWQARCLAEGLQKLGHDVEVLDHESKRVNFAEWKCAFQPVLPTPVPRSDFPLYRQKVERFFEAFCALPLSKPFPLDNPRMMNAYDLVVVGSDEVWNLSHPWYGYYPVFYGDGIRAKQLISYAASFGNYDVSWKPDPEWVSKLNKFGAISVRDENSQTIIRNILGIKPPLVLDPCLQFPILAEIKDLPYIALYGHNFSHSFVEKTLQFAKKRKLPLISIGYRNDWADEQWLTAGPLEFSLFIAQSRGVVTNFFHGCIFAINNNKPFVSETSSYRSHKVKDLMERASSVKHIITEKTTAAHYNACMSKPLDNNINLNIEYLRNISNTWLKEALLTATVVNYGSV